MVSPVLLLIGLLVLQTPAAPAGDLDSAISQLGSFDFAQRTEAARRLRRTDPAVVVPALEAAARSHADEYVRYRALVLLSGIDTAAMNRVASDLLGDRNDRIRTVVYAWFEHHPSPGMTSRLIAALPREASEFVRPALLRALAAAGDGPELQKLLEPLVFRGDDLFRGSVITALGDYGGRYAVGSIRKVAMLDGPLQDDAVTALGRLGDKSALAELAALQKTGPRELQPTVSAALCLLGVDCGARIRFVRETLTFAAAGPAQGPLLRGAVHAAATLARAGHRDMLELIVDTALPAADGAVRDSLTLGLGTVILREPLAALELYETRGQDPALAQLYRDAFDMLAEDFEKEQFGAAVRRVLWTSPEGSPRRNAAASLLDALEF
jgi:hypothetical protein